MRSSRDSNDFRDSRHRDFRRDERDRRQSSASSVSSSPAIKRMKASNSKDSQSPASSQSSKSQSSKSSTTDLKFDFLKISMDAIKAEEDEAINKTTAEQDLKEFRLKCNSIRDICHQVLEAKNNNDTDQIESHRVKGSLLYLSLKTLNRFDKYRCREAKERLQTAKQKVDCFHLQLQNMLYEVMHLQKESKTCLAFRSKDETIDLVPLEEFHNEADQHLKQKANDSHSTHLARLEWELRQRQQLEEKLKSAEEVKKSCEVEIVSKRETLEKLQPMLKSIVEATQPLYSELNLPLQANDATHSMAQYLSRPLYVLYVQLISYRHATKSKFSVSINGTVDDVKTFELKAKDEEEEEENEEQDDEEIRSSKKKKSRHRKSVSHSNKTSLLNKLIGSHPLSVEINFTSNDSTLKCVFSYLLRLEIITIKVSVEQDSTLNHYEVLNESVLSHLLSIDDDGLRSPNPANDHILKAYGIQEFGSLTSQIGFAYDWCQRLAGLDFITNYAKNTSNSLSINSMDQTIKAIIKRFQSRLVLQKQLCNLDNNSIDLPPALIDKTCPPNVCQIKEFKGLHREDFLSFSRLNDQILLDSLEVDNSFIFRALLERGSASMSALILISFDYPKNPPFFHISVGNQTERKNLSSDSSIRELEQLLNCWCPKNCPESSVSSLLSFQMNRLLLGFDVYLEANQCTASGAEGPKEFPLKKVMSRLTIGRDHCIPFHYDSKHVFIA